MRIVILNNNSEAVDYGKYHRKANDVILPIGPTARHYAIENGWDIRTLGSLWSKEDYFKAKEDSENRIKTLVAELNDYSKSVAKKFPLEIGNYFHNNLLIVIGAIHYNYFILDSVQNIINPSKWLFYCQRNEKLLREFFPSSSSILKELIYTCNFIRSFEILDSPLIKEKKHKSSVKQIIIKLLPARMKETISASIYYAKNGAVFPFFKKKLIMLGPQYDWNLIIIDKRFTSKYHVKFERGEQIPPISDPSNELINVLNTSVTYTDKPVYNLIKQARMLQGAIRYFDSKFETAKKLLHKTKGVLVSVLPFPMHNYIAHMAVSMDKPVIVWEHGAHITNDVSFVGSELQYCTHYLTYGHLVKKRISNYVGKFNLKQVIQVGSTRKNLCRTSNKFILYATGKWMFTRIPFIDAIDGDTRLYNAQNDILSYLSEIGESQKILLKANNTPGFNEIPFNIDNIQVEYLSPFTKYLKQAKLVILDTPATTLLEAISTDVPIFVLSGRTPWNKETIDLLKERAVVADTTEELITYIKKYLKDETYTADVHNKEFLEGYGSIESIDNTHKNIHSILKKVL